MAAVYEIDLAQCGPLRMTIEARPARWLHAVFFVCLALVFAALAWSWLCRIELVVAAPGRLRPTSMPIAVTATSRPATGTPGGRVAAVRVRAGERVAAGDVLAVLDTRAIEVDIAALRGTISNKAAEHELLVALGDQQAEQLEAERARTLAEIEQASRTHVRDDRTRKIDLAKTATALARIREREDEAAKLVAGGHASREELDTLRRDRQALEADARKLKLGQATTVEVLQRSLDVLERSGDVERTNLEVRVQALQLALDGSRSELAKAELALADATLRAPIAGVVTDSLVEVGSSLEPGGTAFVIAPDDGYLFEAIVDSADAGHLAVGMPARVAIDTFDAQDCGMIDGTVAYVSADSAAADSDGLRYIVRIEIPTDVIGHGDRLAQLKLGLGGRVRVVVGDKRVLSLLLDDLDEKLDVEWSP